MKKRNIITAVFGTAVLAGAGLYRKTSQFVDERLYRTHIKRTLFEILKPQTVRIKNMNDAILTGHLLEVDHADNTLIMVHGFTKDASSLENEAIYFQSICPHTNILMIDCYGNGSSDGVTRGVGFQDVMDINYWNRFIIQKYGKDHPVFFYGKETGAVALLCAGSAGLLKNATSLIVESTFKNVRDYFAYLMKNDGYPESITRPLLSIVLRKELNVPLDDLDVMRYIRRNTIPTLFIQNKNNNKVDFNDVFDLYNNALCVKELMPLKDEPFYALDEKHPYKDLLTEFLNRNR